MEIVDTSSSGFVRFCIVGFIYTLNENWDGIARGQPCPEAPGQQRNRAFARIGFTLESIDSRFSSLIGNLFDIEMNSVRQNGEDEKS
jgi:hypothetical protein